VLDVVTCGGCGRKTYAQLAHCPQCGHDITITHTEMNLPPEYVEVDDMGVQVFPVRIKRIMHILFIIFAIAVLLAVWLFFLHSARNDAFFLFIRYLFLIFLPVLDMAGIWMVFLIIRGLVNKIPILVLDERGAYFPHLLNTPIPWLNLSDIEIHTVRQRFSTQTSIKIHLDPPFPVFPILFAKLAAYGKKRRSIAIHVISGWPFEAETVRDLLLLGHETWVGNRQISFLAPDYDQKKFALVSKNALYLFLASQVSFI